MNDTDSSGSIPRWADDVWNGSMARDELPQRSYAAEFSVTILVPMTLLTILVLMLSFILCFHHEGV